MNDITACFAFLKYLLGSLPLKKESFESLRLPLAKGSSTSNQAFSIVFTTPSVPLVGDRNLRRKDVTALLGARNRYVLRLADQSGLRQINTDLCPMRAGIAGGREFIVDSL